jgi:hypothetical protein
VKFTRRTHTGTCCWGVARSRLPGESVHHATDRCGFAETIYEGTLIPTMRTYLSACTLQAVQEKLLHLDHGHLDLWAYIETQRKVCA